MGIGGPRLDRPSAVGTEGRPRSASQTVAAVVVVALTVATLVSLGALRSLSMLGLTVTLFVPGMALVARSSIAEQAVGHLLFHAGSVVVVLTLFTIGSGVVGVIVSGLFLALLGVGATWANVLARDQLEEVTQRATVSFVAIIGCLVGFVAVLAAGAGGWAVLQAVVRADDPTTALFGVLAVVVTSGLLVRGVCWALPIAVLASRSKRDTYERVTAWIGRIGTAVAGVAFVAILGGGVLGQDRLARLATTDPSVGAVLGALTSPPLVIAVAAVGAVCGLGTALGLGARKLAASLDAGDDDVLGGVTGGFVVAFLLVAYVAVPLAAVRPVASVLVGFVLVAPIVTIVFGFLGIAAIDGGVVPPRAAGPALSAVGLLVAGVGVALSPLPAPLVFGCVAGAMVVWDCSTFGLGLTVELGHRPETRRLELYHAVLSVGLGVGVVLVGTGVDWLRESAGSEIGAWPAVGLAVLGAVLLAAAAHRREVVS